MDDIAALFSLSFPTRAYQVPEMLRFACIALLAVSTIAAPLPQAGDADVAPQDPASAASAGEPTIAFDPSSFSSGPDFGSGAPWVFPFFPQDGPDLD